MFQHVDAFVNAMARAEKDREKRLKLDNLQLTSSEWERVKLFLGLLSVSSIYLMQ